MLLEYLSKNGPAGEKATVSDWLSFAAAALQICYLSVELFSSWILKHLR